MKRGMEWKASCLSIHCDCHPALVMRSNMNSSLIFKNTMHQHVSLFSSGSEGDQDY